MIDARDPRSALAFVKARYPDSTHRAHVNTHAVQVMPIIPVTANTKTIARRWPSMLRVLVYTSTRFACHRTYWTVTYP